jgi:hypothetical protein
MTDQPSTQEGGTLRSPDDVCDWCGSDGHIIGTDYEMGNAVMCVVKCNNCHHEWGAVARKDTSR